MEWTRAIQLLQYRTEAARTDGLYGLKATTAGRSMISAIQCRMTDRIVVALKGANGAQRALVVNALREKANGDREAARDAEASGDGGPAMRAGFVDELRKQAAMAEDLAEQLE